MTRRLQMNFKQRQRLIDCLYGVLKYQIAALNEIAGEDVLYVTSCLGMWTLYGRRDKHQRDRLLADGAMDVDSLVHIISRLHEGIEVES